MGKHILLRKHYNSALPLTFANSSNSSLFEPLRKPLAKSHLSFVVRKLFLKSIKQVNITKTCFKSFPFPFFSLLFFPPFLGGWVGKGRILVYWQCLNSLGSHIALYKLAPVNFFQLHSLPFKFTDTFLLLHLMCHISLEKQTLLWVVAFIHIVLFV